MARLFRATAYAEQVHATSHFRTLGSVGLTLDNLQAAIGGETYEVEEMYPAFKAVADVQEEKAAHRSNSWAMEAEKVHAGLYEQARQNLLAGRDAEVGNVHICEVCGWTVEGGAPTGARFVGPSLRSSRSSSRGSGERSFPRSDRVLGSTKRGPGPCLRGSGRAGLSSWRQFACPPSRRAARR